MKRHPLLLGAGFFVGLLWVLRPWPTGAFPAGSADSGLKPDDPVRALTVRLDVGAGGADLDEPVFLDLGLGFPFWLHAVGRPAGALPPFGAVPQKSDAGVKVAAGSGATFTFRVDGDPGQDVLSTTPQLLSGVRVGDISRIGFACVGRSNWILGGYDITINGQPFASSKAPRPGGDEARAQAQERLGELGKKLDALTRDLNDLEARGKAIKVTRADRQRFDEKVAERTAVVAEGSKLRTRYLLSPRAIDAQIAAAARLSALEADLAEQAQADTAPPDGRRAALLAEKDWLQGQLQGRYPWFVDPDFPPARQETLAQSARVTVETATHAGADTRNYVYLALGGHRYLLGGPTQPLTAEHGPQTFPLDLADSPLPRAALERGVQLGMVAHALPQGDVADRWHPQRLMLEIDGQMQHDTEQVETDRASLQAVRLVPPAQFAGDGKKVVENWRSVREFSVWAAKKGQGLDWQTGLALTVPPPGAAGAPAPERSLPVAPAGQAAPGTPKVKLGPRLREGSNAPRFAPGFAPLAGEMYPAHFLPLTPHDPSWQPPALKPKPTKGSPIPAGNSFQVDSADITMGWRAGDHFKIEWTVSGDQSAIDHFEVSLLAVRPDQPPDKVYGEELFSANNVAKEQRSYVGTTFENMVVLPGTLAALPCYFVAARVMGVPKDPSDTTTGHEFIGPARAFFPADVDAVCQLLPRKFVYDNATTDEHGEGTFGNEIQASTARGAWSVDAVDGHNAVSFGSPRPGLHIGLRTQPGDTIAGQFAIADLPGPRRLLCHLGFEGAGGDNLMNVSALVSVSDVNGATYNYPKLELANVDAAQPMKLLDLKVDPADVGGLAPHRLSVTITVSGGAIDPDHPPGLFGLRLLPASDGQGPVARPLTADLAIDYADLVPGQPRGDTGLRWPPNVRIRNLGPDDIPAPLVGKIQVYTGYWIGQYGDSVNEAQEAVWCVNSPDTSAPLLKGQTASITPTDPQRLPDGKFTSWTKLFQASAKISLPAGGEIVDPNLKNNTYIKEYVPPLVLGEGPGPYELILYEEHGGQGNSLSLEYKPTLRQKLVPDLGDWNQRASSFRIGPKIAFVAFTEPNFVGPDRNDRAYLSRHFVANGSFSYLSGGAVGELRGDDSSFFAHGVPLVYPFDKAMRSLILYPSVRQFPTGVLLVDTSVWYWDTVRFFPLPEDPNVWDAAFNDLGPLNGCADRVETFGTSIEIFLFEGRDFQGASVGFAQPVDPQQILGLPTWIRHDIVLDGLGFEDRANSMTLSAVDRGPTGPVVEHHR
jgi:hypothetical protein